MQVQPEYSCGIVVPPEVHRFEDLGIRPRLTHRRRNRAEVRAHAEVTERWSAARVMGSPVSLYLRRTVLLQLMDFLFGLIGGRQWSRVEKSIARSNGQSILDALRENSRSAPEIELARKLGALTPDLVHASPRDRVRLYSGLAREHFDLANLERSGTEKDSVSHRLAIRVCRPLGLLCQEDRHLGRSRRGPGDRPVA